MAALLVALLFTTAFAASIWSMWVTIAPRLPYMRTLLLGDAIPALTPAVTPRIRTLRPVAVSTMGARPLRAAA